LAKSELDALDVDPPDRLRIQLRAYLAVQQDQRRIGTPVERLIFLSSRTDGIQELDCPEVNFASGSRLHFKISLEKHQTGWRLIQFLFHLRLPAERTVDMVRIHLNKQQAREPLLVPRCHMHIGGGSRAHVPFPIMSPRLILHLICDVIEPDVGTNS